MGMTRMEALAARLETYNTGKPCKYGHTSDRKTKTGACIECRREYYAKYRNVNATVIAKQQREWRERNKERLLEPQRQRNREYYARNKAIIIDRQKATRDLADK